MRRILAQQRCRLFQIKSGLKHTPVFDATGYQIYHLGRRSNSRNVKGAAHKADDKICCKTVLDNIFLIIAIALLLVVLGLLLFPKRKRAADKDSAVSHGYESLGNIVDGVVTHVEAAKAEGYPAYEEKPQTPVAVDATEAYEVKPMQTF